MSVSVPVGLKHLKVLGFIGNVLKNEGLENDH